MIFFWMASPVFPIRIRFIMVFAFLKNSAFIYILFTRMFNFQKMWAWQEFQSKNQNFCPNHKVKFIYSEKTTKFCQISILLFSYVVPVKNKVEISQNFVAFSEYMNFNHILARPVGAVRFCCFECAFCNVAMSAPRINNARLYACL